ncbi:asparagine synthase (glutamine-hydrolyzing) [Psychroserpens mesophilus]|uniref:asparagine synthase (glutamine-hydrolyzing) n=1 Tax=Psychroserpens mesophilus TaxID=325473 RepID=UPI003D64E768
MCGFLGEFCYKKEKQLTPSTAFSQLLELSKHRGPDASGVTKGENYQLGFNRLAILDLSALGNQPKQSPSGRYQVVFNGEIYNYKHLAELHHFQNLKSSSDTEVLIHLLDEIGVEATIKSLNGMFAIAIVDINENQLHLTRDFAGIKPLFYGTAAKGTVFASQFDQVFKHSWFKDTLKLRPEIMKEYFGFGYMQAPNTVYKQIFQVQPGALVTWDNNGEFTKKQLVEFKKNPKNQVKENEQTSNEYNKLLDVILKRQLVSDVPIASFLSGGIDSPLIAAHAKNNKIDIEAFTLEVADEKINESEIAKEYASALSIHQKIIKAEASDVLNCMDDYFDKCSEPFGDYSSLPTYLLSMHATKRHKVMLSGDGGDELFYGYPRFKHVLDNMYWFKVPFKIRKPIVRFFNKYNINSTPAPYYYKTLSEWLIAKHLQIFPHILDKMFPKVTFSKSFIELYDLEGINSKKRLMEALKHNEFYAHLQRVLVKVDRASMANSLEVRVPFLDKESVDFSWRLDSKFLKHKILKKTLKDSLQEFIPERLLNKKKMGFSVPLDGWLRNELKKDVMYHVFEIPFYGAEYLNLERIQTAVTDFYNYKGVSAWGIWHIYAWQKWAVKHVTSHN